MNGDSARPRFAEISTAFPTVPESVAAARRFVAASLRRFDFSDAAPSRRSRHERARRERVRHRAARRSGSGSGRSPTAGRWSRSPTASTTSRPTRRRPSAGRRPPPHPGRPDRRRVDGRPAGAAGRRAPACSPGSRSRRRAGRRQPTAARRRSRHAPDPDRRRRVEHRACRPPLRLGIVTPVVTRLPRRHARWEETRRHRRGRRGRHHGRGARLRLLHLQRARRRPGRRRRGPRRHLLGSAGRLRLPRGA